MDTARLLKMTGCRGKERKRVSDNVMKDLQILYTKLENGLIHERELYKIGAYLVTNWWGRGEK